MLFLSKVSLSVIALFGVCSQADVVGQDWLFPSLPDGGSVIQVGSTYTLSWTAQLQRWFPGYLADADSTNCDLWVVSKDDSITHKIATGINTVTTLSIQWKAYVDLSDLQSTTIWRFRFRRSGWSPPARTGDGEIASPEFVMRADPNNAIVTTTTTTTTTTSTTTTTTTTTSTTTSRTTTSLRTSTTSSTRTIDPTSAGSSAGTGAATQTPQPSGSSGLSGGAIGGLVIGAVAVIAIIAAIAFFFLRRRNRDAHGGYAAPAYSDNQHGNEAGYNREYDKVPMQQTLSAPAPQPYDGSVQTRFNELH